MRLPPVAVLAVLLAVAGCSSGGPKQTVSSGSTPSPSASATPTPSAASSSSGAPTASPSSAAAAGPTACTTAQLTLAKGQQQGATGHEQLVLTLTNASKTTCTLDGYPGVQLLDNGRKVKTTPDHGAGRTFPLVAARTVTLKSGGVGSFDVEWQEVPAGSTDTCSVATQIAVIPPGNTQARTVAVQVRACENGRVGVSPIVAGAQGVH